MNLIYWFLRVYMICSFFSLESPTHVGAVVESENKIITTLKFQIETST